MKEQKVNVFAEELDDLIEERVTHFMKGEVQRRKDLKGQVVELQEELATCKKELTRATRHGCIARYFEALDIDEEKVQWTVASQVELIFNRLDDLEVDNQLTVLERKVNVFAEELDDFIKERVAHFTKWEVQRHKDLKGQVMELQEELGAYKNELTRATRQGCIAVQPRRKKMPELRSYAGAREARQVDNFFWHLEWYFEALDIDNEEKKVHMAVMYLTDTAASWWRHRYTDGCDVKTWEKFKRELQRQLYLDSVDDKPSTAEAEGSICEYVKEYSALMLKIPEMSERRRLCFFFDGLQYWVATELQRREPHDLASAMMIVERLGDFKQCERLRSPRHERAKGRGDGRSKSGSPKATNDERNEDEGRRRHHKGEKKHGGSRKQGDSRDYKAHGGPRGGCLYGAGLHCGRYCPHKGVIKNVDLRICRWTGKKDFNIIDMDEFGVVLGMDFMKKSSTALNPYCRVMMMIVGKEGQPEWMISLVSKDGGQRTALAYSLLKLLKASNRAASRVPHTVSLCHQGPPCVRWYQSQVAQGTVASAKKILWDSLLRKTMANTKERIDALEAHIHDMFKSDQDAPGILKQFSLRLDALEVNLEATDNTRYAESMEWEGKFQELQDRVEHHARHSEGIDWESKFQELQDRVELLSRVVVNTPAGGVEHSSRPRVPEPKSYGGARDAKELENFLFDIEQYFRAIRVDSEATKVSMAAMYLVGDAKLWWRKKYAEIEDGSCVINTWEILKRELKSQFFPENTAFNARKALLECKHTGSVREYCQAFSALMLDISDMFAVDRLFFFMEGLKPWARTDLDRRRVNNLNEAIIAAKSLSDYNSEPQRPPQRGNSSRGIGGKKPGGPVPNQSWGSKSSWASNSSTQQKSGVGFKAKPDASTSGEVQRGEQSGSRPRHPPTDEQTDTQDYEEEDAVGAFPQWCNAVTTQVGNPKKSLTGKEPKDMLPKKKGDVPGKGLMWQELLAEFNFMLEYRAGSTNSVADALSRRAELDQVALMAMNAIVRADSRVAINIGKKIKKALTRDLVAQQLLKLIESGKSAFEIVNGQQPLLPHTVNVPNARKSPRAISFSKEWRQNIDLAHFYLEKAAKRMKKHADKNRRSQEFNVGDKVMVKLLQQDRKFLRGRDSRLLQKYEGPLTIVKKIGKMAYKVDPPHWWSRQLHPVFHVSMLKPFYEDTADPSRGQIKRQGLKPKAAGKRVAEAILNDRVIIASRKCHQEYLVKWQGHMDEENTWERAADLSAYADKIEAYHMQKLTRASTDLVGENVTGCPLHPPGTAPPRPSSSAPLRPSNRRPCALTSSSSLAPMRPSSTAPARPIAVPAHVKSQQ
ncbi:hypothetical protein RJ639_012842 [Escallonia herrerae]|uniref:Chromo domain-containing protein n=1 Tax=Escallonia herrerae TaxID=1293975 RepID=A0AA88VQZ6_9ASTE|nr:hypothetical protein RJ639_012842 [Escallonia herrerae]